MATRSCQLPVAAVAGAEVTTIEGLAPASDHPLQKAWVELNVAQCGYCQSGMIMAAAALLKTTPKPTEQQINEAVNNICRCGTYPRVKAAIQKVAGTMQS
jgi:isoquinoline 1-oxidoreductase alpha subunit